MAYEIERVSVWRRPDADFVEVRLAEGLLGYGEGRWCESLLTAEPERVLGRTPLEAEAIFDELTAVSGETPGGLDIAIWDLAGKILEQPIASFFGKPYRDRVLACANGPAGAFRMVRADSLSAV